MACGGPLPGLAGSQLALVGSDMLREVLEYVGWAGALQFERVCHTLRRLSRTHFGDEVWKYLYAAHFPHRGADLAHRVDTLRLEHISVLKEQHYTLRDWRQEMRYDVEKEMLTCVQTLGDFGDEVWVASWAPCGRYLGIGCNKASNRPIAVYKLHRTPAGGLTLRLYDECTTSRSIAMLDWCPDSSKLLVSTTENRVLCYKVATKRFYDEMIITPHFDCYARWCSDTEFFSGAERSDLVAGAPSWQDLGLFRVTDDAIIPVRSVRVRFSTPTTMHYPQPVVTDSGEVFSVFAGCNRSSTCGPCHLGVVPLNTMALESEELNIKTHQAEKGDASAGGATGALQSTLSEVAVPLKEQPGAIIGLSAQQTTAYILLNIRPFAESPPVPVGPHHVAKLSSVICMQLSRVSDGAIVKQFVGHRGYSSDSNPFLSWPSISPHSPHIAVGSEDSLIYVYNLNHEHLVAKLVGHTALVNCVMWHPRLPDVLISSSDDCTAKLWVGRATRTRLQDTPFFQSLDVVADDNTQTGTPTTPAGASERCNSQ